MKSPPLTLNSVLECQANEGTTSRLKVWEVAVPNLSQAAVLLATTKTQAIQTAIELFPGINPNAVSLWEVPEWI